MEALTFLSKNVKHPNNEYYFTGISGLEAIENPFKVVIIAKYANIKEIDSLESRQVKNKGRNLALIFNPKLFHDKSNSYPLTRKLPHNQTMPQ